MNLQQLRYARALAELGSFSLAADHCAVTQPTLSNGIAQLERELGHQLFARTTRSVRLTETGKHLLPDILDLLQAQTALVARAHQLSHPERQLIRLGVSPVIGVPFVDMLTQPFRQANPTIDMIFRELNLTDMLGLLDIGQLDIVFGPSDPNAPETPGRARTPFFDEPLIFIPSSRTKLPFGHADFVTLADISPETFVMVPDACGLTKGTRALFQQHGLPLHEYAGQAMSYAVLQDWAALGIGSAILPRSKRQAQNAAALSIVDDTGTPAKLRYFGHWRSHATLTHQTRSLTTYLKDVMPTLAQGLAT